MIFYHEMIPCQEEANGLVQWSAIIQMENVTCLFQGHSVNDNRTRQRAFVILKTSFWLWPTLIFD